MIQSYVIFILLWLYFLPVDSINTVHEHNFEPSCNIHVSNPGFRTPPQTIPLLSNNLWQYPSTEDLERYYHIGKQRCNDLLSSHNFSYNYAEIYTNSLNLPQAGQTKCRGVDTLYAITGMIVYPFGPIESCPPYSKCWFGLLTCGTFDAKKLQRITKTRVDTWIDKQINISNSINRRDLSYDKWSIKSLSLHLRLVGIEIVVPEQRYYSLSIPNRKEKDDIIIAQYHLTIPHDRYTLEARHVEFYPAVLLPWATDKLITQYGTDLVGNIFLGGCEGRCRPFTHCALKNYCCGCDQKSFVMNTPIIVTSLDHSSKCMNHPNMKLTSQRNTSTSLPLCPVMNSSSPGRWILSSNPHLTPHCDEKKPGNIYNSTLYNKLSRSTATPSPWFEASGDPCYINGVDRLEELQKSQWFYAPYTCKYHFYNAKEVKQCLQHKQIRHIHFQGDSMSRDLFASVSQFLGIPQKTKEDLKRMTNVLKQNNIQFKTDQVLVSEGYAWDWELRVMKLSETDPLPDVIVANYALAHRNDYPYDFTKKFEETELNYWQVERKKTLSSRSDNANTTKDRMPWMPKYLIYQNSPALHGRRNHYLSGTYAGNVFRKDGEILRSYYAQLGFVELDEYLITMGKVDTYIPHSDGWHFTGTKRQMEVIIFFNMLCNDWYQSTHPPAGVH